MWHCKGRSGIGDTFTGEAYEDMEGLTPNGRQFVNPLTKETRNLSGANYWHLRKAQSSDEMIKPDVWTVDGKPNITAFSDSALGLDQKKPSPKKEIPISHKIVPQEKTLDRLDNQEMELHKALKAGQVGQQEFERLVYALNIKRERAWKARCKALGIQEQDHSESQTQTGFYKGKTPPRNDDLSFPIHRYRGEVNASVGGLEAVQTIGLWMQRNKDKLSSWTAISILAVGMWIVF